MAAQALTMGQNVMKLGTLGPLPQQKLPCNTFVFMDTKEPGLFSKQNNRVAAKGIMMGQIGLKLSSRIGYWLQQTHLVFGQYEAVFIL